MAHQPLIFPMFASAGLMPDLIRLGSFSSGLCFRTSVANGSKLIAGKLFRKEDMAQLLLPQYQFQELLIEKFEAAGGRLSMGCKVEGFEERGEGVDVHVSKLGGGRIETIEAIYLIGADGAHSNIRRLLSLPFSGTTLDTQLVATDILFDFPAHGFYDANFIIDPDDYGLIGRIDNYGLWRVSYGVPRNTSEEDIFAGVDQKLQKMLPNFGLKDGKKAYEVKRVAPYKAQQRVAETFWKEGGRVGVVGDAAHCKQPNLDLLERRNIKPDYRSLSIPPLLSTSAPFCVSPNPCLKARTKLTPSVTNPYAGLGLASGIADAYSLAEVLIHILSPTLHSPNSSSSPVPSTLLSSWSKARKNMFLDLVDKPSRAAYRRVKSKVDTEEEIQAFLERDQMMGALKKGMPLRPPSLVTNGSELEGW